MPKVNLRLQNYINMNYTEVKSVKMIVLLHPQGFTDTPTGKTHIQSSFCHSQAVSQLEFGRVRQYRCNS